jgi:hypothetical protein
MDALFRQSGLLRDKWENREDYRRRSIDAAIDQTRETFDPSRNGRPSHATPDESQTTSTEADEKREAIREEASSGPSSSFSTSDNVKADEQDASMFTVPKHWKRRDLADLRNWQCDPLEPIVDGMIARGNVVYVAAETQTGKTLLKLYMARKMIQGGDIFGKFKITPVDKIYIWFSRIPTGVFRSVCSTPTTNSQSQSSPSNAFSISRRGSGLTTPRCSNGWSR